jgi:hypothetical protein
LSLSELLWILEIEKEKNMKNSKSYKFIKNQALVFMHRYYRETGSKIKFPIELEKMAKYLGYEICYKDLPEDVNALTDMVSKQIVMSESLDTRKFPGMKGRYKFTLAHEIAHIVLHQKEYEKVYYRCKTKGDFSELQNLVQLQDYETEAEIFAGNLILPRDLLKKEFYRRFGTQKIIVKNNMLFPARAKYYLKELKYLTKASNQALQIALKESFLLSVAS